MPQKKTKRREVALASMRAREAIKRLEDAAAGILEPTEQEILQVRISDEIKFIERLTDRLLIRCPNG